MKILEKLKNLWRRPRGGHATAQGFVPMMLAQLGQTKAIEYSCDDVHKVLDQFAEAVLRGEDVAVLMPLVAQHLGMCPDCQEEFEALLRMLKSEGPRGAV